MWLISNYFFACFISAILGSIIYLLFSQKFKNYLYALKVNRFLRSITILEINNSEECRDACAKLKSQCQDLSALGFDCEWVSEKGKKRPVALLQLATPQGLCCLFRLNLLQCIPKELQDILCDYKIIKLGVSPLHDSNLLLQDYNVQVRSTLDLRFLYPSGRGLAAMAASEIGVKLNKAWKLKCSNWENVTLTDEQKDYAAKDAFVAIEIYKKWVLTKDIWKTTSYYDNYTALPVEISRYLDINFSEKKFPDISVKNNNTKIKADYVQKRYKSTYMTRKTPLYHNCFMHAPDGELLCSCDRRFKCNVEGTFESIYPGAKLKHCGTPSRKAQWYVDRGLAEVLPGEPYSIRLLFEPEARPDDTNGGRFYQHLKQNRCVVCGALDSYLKHNVVPKEYRKHFPNVMKDHQSHDIVLMCVSCHYLASQKNEILRNALADNCKAPITASKVTSIRALKKVKNSAKALLNAGDVIPESRKTYLENEVKKHYEVDTLTPEILETAANLNTTVINDQHESHGLKVVNYFTEHGGGLTELEVLWRMHFLDTMKPQYLPTLWSVNHNHSRLATLANEDYQK